MLVIRPRADASIGPYNLPGGGFLLYRYHTGLQILAVRITGPGIPCNAVPGGGSALFRHVSPFCFRGLCDFRLHVRGDFAAG